MHDDSWIKNFYMETSCILSLSSSIPLQSALNLTSCVCLDMSDFYTTPNIRQYNDKQDSACEIITFINKFLCYTVTGTKHFRWSALRNEYHAVTWNKICFFFFNTSRICRQCPAEIWFEPRLYPLYLRQAPN